MSKRLKVQVHYDVNPFSQYEGHTFFNCALCVAEMPGDTDPYSYARQQASITAEGYVQIRCNRHDVNIATLVMKAVEV